MCRLRDYDIGIRNLACLALSVASYHTNAHKTIMSFPKDCPILLYEESLNRETSKECTLFSSCVRTGFLPKVLYTGVVP